MGSVFNSTINSGSLVTAAMDIARGGKFTTPPTTYPTGAWYTYDDKTCEYNCMAVEYTYWGIAAYVGALAGKKADIAKEWRFATRAELIAGDVKLTAIIQDTTIYKMPSVSPNGIYKAPKTCSTGGAAHGGN